MLQLLIQEYDHHIAHLYHTVTGAKENYNDIRAQDLVKWETRFSNDIGRLAQGVGTLMKTGNKNILFISRSKVPSGRNIMYVNPVCEYHPHKDDPYRIRLTIVGDKITYPLQSGSPATILLGAKIIFNSVISTPGS